MLALGGCVLATPEPTPMPSTISTSPPATTSPTPEALPTPESSLTPPESSDFTRDQLIDLCITDSTEFSGMENRVADTDLALVERRAVDPAVVRLHPGH